MKECKVQYWYQNRDDYDFDILNTKANSSDEAIINIQEGRGWDEKGNIIKPPKNSKSFKVIWMQK